MLLRNYLYTAALISAILFISSCNGEEGGRVDNFDRAEMLQNVGNNIILPAFENFQSATAILENSVLELSNDITQNKLDAAQEAWLNASISWKYAEMFMFGPVDQLNLAASIENWPTNTLGIEESIDTTEPINKAYVQSLGSTRKGIPAIEYLLFNYEQGDQVILDQLSGDPKRVQYLLALSDRLSDIASEINTGWMPSGGNYIETFVSNTGKDAGSSINVLANEFLMLIEKVKNEKLGIPLGKKSMGVTLPENVEARFSAESLVLIQHNLNSIEQVFSGNTGNQDNLGYADYLNAVGAQYNGQPLSEVIMSQIVTIRTALDQINAPLKVAVDTEKEAVEEAYLQAQKLVVLTKADMMSNLGLLVTYTDNDGD